MARDLRRRGETAAQGLYIRGSYDRCLKDAIRSRRYEPRRMFGLSETEWAAYCRDSERRMAQLEHELRGAPVVVPKWLCVGFTPQRYPVGAPAWLDTAENVEVHADDTIRPVKMALTSADAGAA